MGDGNLDKDGRSSITTHLQGHMMRGIIFLVGAQAAIERQLVLHFSTTLSVLPLSPFEPGYNLRGATSSNSCPPRILHLQYRAQTVSDQAARDVNRIVQAGPGPPV